MKSNKKNNLNLTKFSTRKHREAAKEELKNQKLPNKLKEHFKKNATAYFKISRVVIAASKWLSENGYL